MQVNSLVASTTYTQLNAQKDNATKKEQSTAIMNALSASSTGKLDSETIEQLRQLGGKGITNAFIAQFQQATFSVTIGNFSSQSSLSDLLTQNTTLKAQNILSNIDFSAIGYDGKNILSMNKDELNELVSEKGFFGIENTASRIADFVINGAGDDLDKLKSGFEGMKAGFEQAEKLWGEKLPQISQDTIDKAIAKVSARIDELGGKTVDVQA